MVGHRALLRCDRTILVGSMIIVDTIIQATYSIDVIETIRGTDASSRTNQVSPQASEEAPTVDRDAAIAEIAAAVAEISRIHACQAARRLMHGGVSIAHLEILWLLEDRAAMSMGQLADQLGVALANATGLVDRMEQRGLVVRDRDGDDRRVVLVRPTQVGKETLAEVDGWRVGMATRLLGLLETDQLAKVLAGVRELRATLPRVGERSTCPPVRAAATVSNAASSEAAQPPERG